MQHRRPEELELRAEVLMDQSVVDTRRVGDRADGHRARRLLRAEALTRLDERFGDGATGPHGRAEEPGVTTRDLYSTPSA